MNELYINIGSNKCCFFIKNSIFLINCLEKCPLLYYAVEEALQCAKNGYYSIGIITFAQLLNIMNKNTPPSRHLVAHKILKIRPTKKSFEMIMNEVKNVASEYNCKEMEKYKDVKEYHVYIFNRWTDFLGKLKTSKSFKQIGQK
jgi:hypothetical protein